MPYISTKTNTTLTAEQKNTLAQKLGDAISVFPGKSEEYLMLAFEDNQSMYFRGKRDEVYVFCEVKIFGSSQDVYFDSMTKKVCNIMSQVIGVLPKNIYVKYEEVSRWGTDGFNF